MGLKADSLWILQKAKGVHYMVTEGDVTLGGDHTTPCTDDVSWTRTRETYVMLLTSVTPVK